ncbi:hypothetical protein AVEN_111621-1 [Araneus ventricosus]|uniref:Uncharacterized protein n=1 Tax=Araneus ventricosus TaxID=182803 RepID=A0A4Y2C429_ARAVE|nr:hypothetical protein AVEN_111621-1 [Araneus ventricosus]
MEDKTGNAFCVREEDTMKYEWMAQLHPFNTVFQAELLAIQEACLWASKTNQQVKVWSDNESRLHSIASIDTKSPIAQQIQEILLKYTNIKLGWIRAHVGYAKKAHQESASKKRVHHPLAKRMGQWRNRQECLQRFA